ncbi:MAG: exodeoxyribonuclease VII large subunit [Tidjanibacter sp.]|nr:exodeoxyribonuclease VII large subunit [Tidjanibacter sp.]
MTPEKHITLSELLSDVKRTLAERFPMSVWICAEIGELKENRYSGHCYLELIEKSEKDSTPKAKASAAIWRSRWSGIAAHFRMATGCDLAAGMSVLLKVGVTFHEAYGFSLVVSDIDPAYTLGENERRKREIIAALEADGVIDLNRSLPFPTVIQRVAVISSATAAGLQDFRNHLCESPYAISTTLFEAIVQGSSAEESIIAALDEIAEREGEFDAVALIRGGGSQSDLECFNSYALAANIAQFPLPVLTGIGHDKDTSVADLVAARALKTPTAVADFITALAEGYHSEVEGRYEQIAQLATHHLTNHSNRLALCGAKLAGATSSLLATANLSLSRSELALRHSSLLAIERAEARLRNAEAQTNAASPQRILSMGFAMVRRGGKCVTSPAELHAGDRVEIRLSEGTSHAIITENEK